MKLSLKSACKSSIGLFLIGVAACGGGGGGLANNPTYTLGGSVAGLHGSGFVLANGTVRLLVEADGAFTFPTPLANGAPYAVTVDTQPSNPAQVCTVANGSGSISGGNVANVEVSCVTPAVNRKWQTPAPLETSDAGTVEMPAIAMNASGNAALVWRRSLPNTSPVWSSQYSASSKTWSAAAPVALNTSNVGIAAAPEIAIDGNGNAVAVWQQYQNAVWGVWANQFSPGTGWATAVRIDSVPGPSVHPWVTFDSGGNALAVWEQSDGTSYHIWSNTLPAGTAAWHGSTQIDTNVGVSGSPQICAVGQGNVLAVWDQADTLAAPVYQVRSSSYVPNSGTWTPPVLVGSLPTTGAVNARVVCNAAGAAFALWEQTGNNSLWANRYSFATGWTTAAEIPTNGVAPQSGQIAVDAGGNAMAVWREFDASGMDSHTWYAYYSANSGWGVAAQLSHSNASVQDRAEDPQVGFDAAGNALAIWNRFDGTLEFNTSSLYTPGTGWTEPVDVENQGAVLSPVLAVAPGGDALAVWEQANDQAPGAMLWQNRFE
jgi:hypothetical protein